MVVCAATALVLAVTPGPAAAQGLIEALNASQELSATFLTTTTRDAAGETTTFETASYLARSNYRLNYFLLPTLNLSAGGTTERNLLTLTSDRDDTEVLNSKFRPYAWLTFRDPVFDAAVGYDLFEDRTRTNDLRPVTLTRSTTGANAGWRPTGLPSTAARFTRTVTSDEAQGTLDTDQDQLFFKSEYQWRGLDLGYAGRYVVTTDRISETEATQIAHDAKVLYSRTFLDGRVNMTLDNRFRATELTTERGVITSDGLTLLPVLPVAGLSAIDDSPLDGALAANPALIDGNVAASAGVDIGSAQSGQPRRNIGLDFGSATRVSTLRVWVDRDLRPEIAGAFTWEIYTSADNLTWRLHATIPAAPFGPFDRRFEISFPAVSARYLKAATRPLSAAVIGAPLFPTILITEMQAFVDRAAQTSTGGETTIRASVRSHNFDARVILFRTPSLYYRFNGDYQAFDPEQPDRYTISNGLFFTHRLHRILSTSANASVELGSEQDETRTGFVYSASLTATPLPTLTDTLTWSGNSQTVGPASTTSNSIVLYNTAQVYRGIDATLNLGTAFGTDEPEFGPATRRREMYVNAGTGITPHSALTFTAFYLGRQAETSGGPAGTRNTTEHRLDLGASFTPFRTLSLAATVSTGSHTDEETRTTQNYSVSWAPFPDGNLQLSLYYTENRFSDDSTSRIVQPTIRWYPTSRRRSYVEATYQHSTTRSPLVTSESQLMNASLNVPF